jgi:hypothetical protein
MTSQAEPHADVSWLPSATCVALLGYSGEYRNGNLKHVICSLFHNPCIVAIHLHVPILFDAVHPLQYSSVSVNREDATQYRLQ